jgi:hypothetical protein
VRREPRRKPTDGRREAGRVVAVADGKRQDRQCARDAVREAAVQVTVRIGADGRIIGEQLRRREPPGQAAR